MNRNAVGQYTSSRHDRLIEHWMEIAAQAALVLRVLAVYLVTRRECGEMLTACAVIDTETAAIRRLLDAACAA